MSSSEQLKDSSLAARAKRRPAAYIAVAIFAASGLGLYFASRSVAHAAPLVAAQAAPRVTTSPVEERLLTEFEEITGRVEAIETVDLRARVSGHLQAVHFQAGQLVNAGDRLFSIDPRYYRAQADLAKAEVERARVRAEIARREATRADELYAQKAISLEEVDTRRSGQAEAQAALLAAQATLATAELDLEHTDVRAPIPGRVSRAFVTIGNLVSGAPGGGLVLTRIVSTGDAYVYADLDEQTVLRFNRLLRDNQLVTENGRVPVEAQLGDETGFAHRGFIESTDNRLDPATGSLALRMVFTNTDERFVPGLFARVRVPVSEPRRTLLVSERAIGTDQSQKYVLTVAADKKIAYRAVKVGPSVDGLRIVRDGLTAGDQVVVNGLQRVRPGMTVETESAAPAVAAAGNASRTAVAAPR